MNTSDDIPLEEHHTNEHEITPADHLPLPIPLTIPTRSEAGHGWNHYLRPTVASLIAALCSLSLGTMLAYPSPSIPNLNAHPNPVHLNSEQVSWFISLASLGSVLGSLASGWIMDKFGRKLAMMSLALPTVISWAMIVGSQNPAMMYVARVLTGFGLQASLPIVGVYISEISPARIRGLLMSFHELALNFGVLLLYVLGAFLPWNWLAVVCAAISCLLCVLMTFMPESPRWLLMHGRHQDATEALEWLHHGASVENGDSSVARQLAEIQHSLQESAVTVQTPFLDYVRSPLFRSLLLTQAMFALQELSGINVLRSSTVSIFEAAGSKIDPNMASISVGLVLVFGSVAFTCVVELMERRTYAVISSTMMAVGLLSLGFFFKLKECGLHHITSRYLFWLPLFSMMLTVLGYTFGVGPMPYVITSEVFPTRARARASSLGCSTLSLVAFLITKLFTDMTYAIGASGAYWFCGFVCVGGAAITGLMVPKTKGKSLEEIHTQPKEANITEPKIIP